MFTLPYSASEIFNFNGDKNEFDWKANCSAVWEKKTINTHFVLFLQCPSNITHTHTYSLLLTLRWSEGHSVCLCYLQ